MIQGFRTVFRKEFKEIITLRGSVRATLTSLLIPAVFISVLFPLQMGKSWVTTPASLIVWFTLSFVTVSMVIADTFAGERERHTLDTLLATCLSESAILAGKIGAAMVYGFIVSCFAAACSLVTVSLAHGEGHLLMFSPGMLLAGLMTGVLTAGFAASAGTLVSLRAATTRQAQQTLGIVMMVLFFSPMIATLTIPKAWMKSVNIFFSTADKWRMSLLIFGIVAFVNIALMVIARARFKRKKMSEV